MNALHVHGNDNNLPDNNIQGWILSIASGLACCLGASVVFLDLILKEFRYTHYKQMTRNNGFLVASLSLGSGVMLFSSMYHLLPEAKVYMLKSHAFRDHTGPLIIGFYFLGIIGSALLNQLIHRFVVHEMHSAKEEVTLDDPEQHLPPSTTLNHCESRHYQYHCHNSSRESSPLLAKVNEHPNGCVNCYTFPSMSSVTRKITDHDEGVPGVGHEAVCVVESDPDVAVLEGLVQDQHDRNHDKAYDRDHRHDHHFPRRSDRNSLEEDKEPLMRIGIQTALAISIHKFPEGLITFITSQASSTLGFSMFIAIAIHNIAEGFTIALPIYMATQSRIKSFGYTTLLGGCSQPLGALIGWFFIRKSYLENWDLNAVYGGLFAIVSGLMGVIAVQGMLPQAIKHDTSGGVYVNVFFFLGVFVMSLSLALFEPGKSDGR